MCRSCNGTTNVHERIANHDFVEQMREFYGLTQKPTKESKRKNTKKSVFARIEHQLKQLQDRVEDARYCELRVRLAELLDVPFNEATVKSFDDIMDDLTSLLKAEILTHLRK